MSNIRDRRRQARPSTRARYTPFGSAPQLDTLDGREVVKQHLEWMLANLDYYATQSPTRLHSMNRALREDLALLGLTAPTGSGDQAALIEKLRARIDIYEKSIRGIKSVILDCCPSNFDDKQLTERRNRMFDHLNAGYAEYELALQERFPILRDQPPGRPYGF